MRRWGSTLVWIVVVPIAVAVAVAWITPTGDRTCVDGINLETGQRFGSCSAQRGNVLAGLVAFVVALVVVALIRRRRRRGAGLVADAARAPGPT